MCVGNELTPTSVRNQPTEIYWPTETQRLYTLCMTDPDAPSRVRPTSGEFKHWLVVNIPGTNVSQGETLAQYVGSGPPAGTGLHRYVFLVYNQPGRIETHENPIDDRTIEGRRFFKIRQFAEMHHLGEPVAGNFYQAKFDDYVPILHAQLGVNRPN